MDPSFLEELRKTLNHLYDPERLAKSPICKLFALPQTFERTVRFQRLIEEAIAHLKPPATTPPMSRSWRIFRFLNYRYLEQYSHKEVADQLNISQAQAYRIQQAALSALASYLWEKYQLAGKWNENQQPVTIQTSASAPVDPGQVDWLSAPSDDVPSRSEGIAADLQGVLEGVMEVIQPILERTHAEIVIDLPEDVPALTVHPVLLRQLLLNLSNGFIQLDSPHPIIITAQAKDNAVQIDISRQGSRTEQSLTALENTLDAARQIVRLCNGRLELEDNQEFIQALISLPAQEGIPILVVDDNPDQLGLLKRTLRGTPYNLYSTDRPEGAIELAVRSGARVILLDVMMPQLDGWGLLQVLRSHPQIHKIPIVIFSIIPAGDLASALSADAFLQKPVKREELLATLDRLSSALPPPPEPGENSPSG